MKKRFLSIMLAIFVMMSVISVQTFAYSRICEDINFDKFNASDWTSAGAQYGIVSPHAAANGTWITYSAATNDRDNDGKSLKLSINANSAVKTNPGVKYATPDDVPLKGIIHISASHFIEKHDKTGYIHRHISMTPVSGSAVTLAQYTEYANYTYLFSNGENKTGTSTKVPWTPGAWNDIDIWLNLDNNSVTYKLTSNGTVVYNKSFVNENDAYKDGIKEINLYTQTPNWLSSRNDTYAKSTTVYWDNIKIETLDKMPSETATSNTSDFNSYTPSGTITSVLPSVPSGVTWTYANANGKGVNYEATDKGVSLKYTGSTTATSQLRMNFSPAVTSVKSKFSAQVSDKVSKPLYIITGDGQYIQAALFYDGGHLSVFGNSVLKYELNHWYDIEYSFNAQNGAYHYRVNDGENEYMGSGVLTQNGLSYPNTIQRVMFQVNKAASASSIIIDDFMLDTIASDFRLDRDLSVNEKTLATNETVYARFTKELNETPTTLADKVFEYYGNAQITSVSLIDKYTVKAEFEKEIGKSYRIDFKNIVASDGSTTSDYIEFDVKKEDLYLTESIFKTESGEIPALLKAGKITSSIDACANNGKSFKFIYALALYGDSELKAIDSDIINIGSQEQTYTRTLTVPSDGSYVLKAFVWDAVSLEPIRKPQTLKATPDNKPVAIVKLDDLRADNDTYITPFTDIASWSGENGIRISAGIIGESLETSNATEERIAKIKALANNKNVELWFHGYANANTFASDDNEQAQREDFQKGIAAAAKHGITFKTFNPPSNNMRPITAQLIENEFTNFTTVMALSTSGQAYSSYLDRCNDLFTHIKVEPSATGNTDTVDNLKALWNSMSSKKYVLLQAHPAGWTNYEGSEERFKEFLLWLKSEGVVFMTPSEYTAYINTLN